MSPRERAEAFAAALRAEGVDDVVASLGVNDQWSVECNFGNRNVGLFFRHTGMGGRIQAPGLYATLPWGDAPRIARWLKTGVWE